MIGVAVKTSEQAIAAEFFELFKTPWEFCRNGRQYDVVICTSEPHQYDVKKLLLIFDSNPMPPATERKPQRGGFVVSDEGKRVPIYGLLTTFPGGSSCLLREEATREPAAFVGRYGNAASLRIGFNVFEEVNFLLTIGQPVENAQCPALEDHIDLLREWITLAGLPLVEIPPVPIGHGFIACLTHDVDHPTLRDHRFDFTMLGFLYRATIGTCLSVFRGKRSVRGLLRNWKAAFLLPFVHLGVARDFWDTFDRYLDIEAGHRSTFFVIPRRNYAGRTTDGFASSRRACRYDVRELLPRLQRIMAAKCEVAVHGLDAWLDVREGRKERERISQAFGSTELGVRMHWLFFDQNSPTLLERAGFTYDSTIGYNETVGFRAGTAQAYRPPGVKDLLELPLHVMDTALFYPNYLNLSERTAEALVWGLIDVVERIGGALTINWHDRSIAPERLWDAFYLKLLCELKHRGAWLPTAAKAVAWFRKRRAAIVESIKTEAGMIKVRGLIDAPDQLPGLRIRIHKPRADRLDVPIAGRKAAQFVDVPLNDSTELNIAL